MSPRAKVPATAEQDCFDIPGGPEIKTKEDIEEREAPES